MAGVCFLHWSDLEMFGIFVVVYFIGVMQVFGMIWIFFSEAVLMDL